MPGFLPAALYKEQNKPLWCFSLEWGTGQCLPLSPMLLRWDFGDAPLSAAHELQFFYLGIVARSIVPLCRRGVGRGVCF